MVSESYGGAPPEVMLGAVLDAVHRTGTDAITVLRPVHDHAGEVVDFEIVAATDLVGALTGISGPLVGSRLSESRAGLGSQIIALNREVLTTGEPLHHKITLDLPTGGSMQTRTGVVARIAAHGLVVVLWSDVTDKEAAGEALRSSERRFRALVERATDLVVTVDEKGTISYASPSVGQLGYTPDEVCGQRAESFDHENDLLAVSRLLEAARAAAPGAAVSAPLRWYGRSGDARWVQITATNHLDDPAVGCIVLNGRDITVQREGELLLRQQALEDTLTGLPNRRWFLDALRHAGARSERTGRPMALLLIDVDNFKMVNDSLGHPAGDALLVVLARRMLAALRPADHVARLGGDEFVVLAEDLNDETDAVAMAERLVEATSDEYTLDGYEARITLSIGVSAAQGRFDPDSLLADADAAMYEAKRRGRNGIRVFDPQLRHNAMRRLQLQGEISRALRESQFELHWQPIMHIASGAIHGAEALIRWRHPTRGVMPPSEFLDATSDAGLMPELCEWVAHNAVAQAARWAELPTRPDVYINLDRKQLTIAGFPEALHQLTTSYGVDPRRISLELSELMLSDDLDVIAAALAGLRENEFRIALDDFGAGNTSLSWLHKLPIDLLKLDQRFTRSLASPTTEAIVRSVVDLTRALGIASVAEGVETTEQASLLRAMGCDYLQGYHIARPQSVESVSALLARPSDGAGRVDA
jgi:diguanylate cyclase (GGDEF)-like protein/PAS domain S-box-containing protein